MEKHLFKENTHQLSGVMLDKSGMYSPFIRQLKLVKLSGHPELCCVTCLFDTDYFNDRLYQQFGCAYPSSLHQAVPKRQAEYLAGRVAAMNALADFGVVSEQVLIGRNRSPIWPTKFFGAISHTDKSAFALVGKKTHYRYVGIDCEHVFSSETALEVEPMILNASEKTYLSMLGVDYLCFLTLTFSAKETLFKALHPHVQEYFDFDAAEISDICFHSKCFVLTLRKDLSSTLTKGVQFTGYFLFERHTVITFLCSE